MKLTWADASSGGSTATAAEGGAAVAEGLQQVEHAAVDGGVGDAAAEGRLGAHLAAHHVARLHAAHEQYAVQDVQRRWRCVRAGMDIYRDKSLSSEVTTAKTSSGRPEQSRKAW